MTATNPGAPPFAGLQERKKQALQTLAGLVSASDGATTREEAVGAVLGFAPPCRGLASPTALEASLHALHEQLRTNGLKPAALDTKTAHLLLTALLLIEHGAAAAAQGLAARRAGVTQAELEAVAALAFATHGLAGAARGDEFLAAVAAREQLERLEGAVAAYG